MFVIAYTGLLLVVLQAAAVGLSEAQTSSWVWAIALGNGFTSIFMSLYFRVLLIAYVAFPDSQRRLLSTALLRFILPQTVGAYTLVGLATIVSGRSGLFAKGMALVPQPIVMGILSRILLRFGLVIFSTIPSFPLMAAAMIATYFQSSSYWGLTRHSGHQSLAWWCMG